MIQHSAEAYSTGNGMLPQKHHGYGSNLVFFFVHTVSYRGPPALETTLRPTSAKFCLRQSTFFLESFNLLYTEVLFICFVEDHDRTHTVIILDSGVVRRLQ